MKSKTGNPYIGPRAFQEGETLYGRDRELSRLLNLLIAERIVLLYSSSGAGKTSLIQAALMPALREEGFRALPVIRVGMESPPEIDLPSARSSSPVEMNRYLLSTLLSLEEGLPPEQQTPLDALAGMDLTSYLEHRLGEDTEADGDVLIFDQFEEILTVDPTDQTSKVAFFAQLGEALRSRNRWALFAMREEYPAGLDPYLRPIPTRLNTTFRLELLGVKAAREAMQEPARRAGRPFHESAATKLIDDLRRVQVQQPDGSTAERPGTSIEPVQLQVVCYRLWENLPNDATEIRDSDIREAGDVDSALAGYYGDRVENIANQTGVRERKIREWFDRQLITEQGIRGQVLRGPGQSQGLDNQAIAPLVDAHLVRAENRRGATWYELAHDRLIEPVRTSNADWFQANLSTLQRQVALWESQNRPSGLLLRNGALEDAEHWATNHDNELIAAERDFLRVCRETRAQVQRERRKNRFIQGLAIVATLIMLVAIYFFIHARQSEHAAIHAKNDAEEARVFAEMQREEAEEAKDKAIHQSRISLTQVLTFQSLQQQEYYQDTRAALLARQAYLFNQEFQAGLLSQVDRALRPVVDALRFKSTILDDHEDLVRAVAFSPDGRMLASGSYDKMVRLWDLTIPDAVPIVLQGHEGRINTVAFSPDGRKLASGGTDTNILLWDLTNLEKSPRILHDHAYHVNSVVFSPDGRSLASGGGDGTVRLWDLTRPDTKPHIINTYVSTLSLAFSPDGRKLALGCDDKTLRLWDVTKPGIAPVVLNRYDGWVTSVAFSPDGRMLASGSYDKTAQLLDLTKPDAAPGVLRGHKSPVISVTFSPDGQTLASGSGDNTVRLWNLTTPTAPPILLRGHGAGVTSVVFGPDGQTLASGSGDKTVRLWDLEPSDTATTVLRGHEGFVLSVAFSSDSKRLASGSFLYARLWDLANPNTGPNLLHHGYVVFSVAFSPDGQTLASGSHPDNEDTTVRLWDLRNLDAEPTVLHGHIKTVNSVTFSPDGRMLATGSDDTTIRLWNLENHSAAPIILQGHEGPVKSVAFSSDSRMLASGSNDNTVRLWDLTMSDVTFTLLGNSDGLVQSVTFSPDGNMVASASADEIVRLWDLTKPNAAPVILRGHENWVSSVAFSPDGGMLASGGGDKTVRLWDLKVPDTPLIILQTEDQVLSVVFSPDGKFLASGNLDGSIFIWKWRTENLADMVCQKVWRNLTMQEWRQFISPDIPYERTCPNLPAGEGVSPKVK